MELDNDTLKKCIFNLLTGLEIQDIDSFMKRLTPDNCLKLGQFYMQGVKEKIKEKDIVIEKIVLLAAKMRSMRGL